MVVQWFGLAYLLVTLVQAAGAVALVGVGLRVRSSDRPAGCALAVAGLAELSFLSTCIVRTEAGRAWSAFGDDSFHRVLDVLALLAPLEHALVAGLCGFAALRLLRLRAP